MTIPSANTTLQDIEIDVRKFTSSPGQSALTTAEIYRKVQTYYTQTFPYTVKMDVLRDVYTLFTSPYVDRYPLDINLYQGIRDPFYVEGIQGRFFKDRQLFYGMWPRFPAQMFPASGDGMTTSYVFQSGGPILAKEVVIGSVDINGRILRITDDGGILAGYGNHSTIGNLFIVTTDSQGDIMPPAYPGLPPSSPIPTMAPPAPPTGPYIPSGTVNYVTGEINLILPLPLQAGAPINVWVSQYQAGRPYCMLFWNNEFVIRPVPNNVYKIEIEAYKTPIQFLSTTQSPILNQWQRLISLGAAFMILEERQDMDGLTNIGEMYDRQESICLERQATEEIGQRNTTPFSNQIASIGFGGWQNSWY